MLPAPVCENAKGTGTECVTGNYLDVTCRTVYIASDIGDVITGNITGTAISKNLPNTSQLVKLGADTKDSTTKSVLYLPWGYLM